jgi:predicted lipoprotein with Yx(FWY)xxD motif
MMRLTAPATAIAAALAIGACGGGGGGGGGSAAAPSGGETVATSQISGVGRVLVDQSGKPIYTSDQEASGKIVCATSACTTFWKPVEASRQMPSGDSATGKLGVVRRPDGSKQLTANGRPLYTFAEDSPGQSTGDGFTDDFDGRHFTWHVVLAGGKPKTAGSGSSGSDSGGSDQGLPNGDYGSSGY